jgi:hypothetical protein
MEYYLAGYPIPVITGVDQPGSCAGPGTLVAAPAAGLMRQGAVLERVVYSPSGEAIYLVYGIRR